MNKFERVIKFLFDRVMAFIGLAVLSLPLLVIAVAVKRSIKGLPVIYTQTRVGKDGKLFRIHKFRTMTNGQEVSNVAYPNRALVTPTGAWLRRHKLDELPELWNVLVGDMSFVGPRPDVPGYADQLQGEDRLVLAMRPGITGPATLKYRNEDQLIESYVKQAIQRGDARTEEEIALQYNDEVIFPDKVRINLDYYRNAGLLKDLVILLKTIL